MKILLFSPYYPPHTGGLETHSAELNKYLAQRKEVSHITVLTPHFPVTAPAHQENGKITIIRFPAIEVIPNYPLPAFWKTAFQQLWNSVQQEQFDIVLSRTRFFTTSLAALLYSKQTKTPWIHIEHGSDFIQLANPFTNLVGRIYDYTAGWLIFRFSDVNVAISQAVAGFVTRFTSRKSPIIYRGIEKDSIIAAPINEELVKRFKDKILIGFVGRLIDGKGVKDLLTAIQTLDDQRLQAIIIGDGPQKERLKSFVKELNIADQVVFLGNQPQTQAMSALKACAIFVNPSYTEGLPTSVLEAALCHTAIIATDVGGTKEIITDKKSGFLIQPKNITMLTERLKRLIDDEKLRTTFSEAAYESVNARFSWPESADAYIALIKKVVERS